MLILFIKLPVKDTFFFPNVEKHAHYRDIVDRIYQRELVIITTAGV